MSANWFIPCRRAALTANTSYRALIDEWLTQLETHRDVMVRWYGVSEFMYDLALVTVRHWQASFFPDAGSVAAVRDGEVTLDSVSFHYKPRLWKGAQRVLREAAAGPEEPGDRVFDPLETEDPPLRLTPAREIDNAEAPLLMGDVVEMPLFRFLTMAGRGDMASHAFNPDGSYLLGTSLAPDGNESPALHDNLVGMRFQVLLDCMVGSFYHPRPVIDHERAVSAPIEGDIAPAPAPASDPRATLLAEARRVYEPVSFGDASLFKQELAKVEADPRWADVQRTTRDKLTTWANQDWEGNPPPRAFTWRIADRFETLSAQSSLSESQTREAEVLMELHDAVTTRLQEWVLELTDFLDLGEWDQVQVDSKLPTMTTELTAAQSIARPCPWMCRDDHARIEISALIKALRGLVAELEKAPGAGSGANPSAPSGPAIYARGMVYAATLYGAADRWWYKDPTPAWHYYTNQWGRDSKGRIPTCLPYRYGLDRFPRDLPVTPGSVCSDTTLLLLNYMIRNHGESGAATWGRSSVGRTMRSDAHYRVQDFYEYVPDEEVAKWAPTVTREDKLDRLDRLIEKCRELYRNVATETSYWSICHQLAVADPRWASVGDKTRGRLERYQLDSLWGLGPPYGYAYYLSAGLRAHDGDAYELLAALHDNLIEGTRTFSRLLEELIADPDWTAFETDGYDFSKRAKERAAISSIPEGGFIGRYGDNHAIARGSLGKPVRLIKIALEKKITGLEKLAAKPDKIKDSVGGRIDLSDKLGDVNNVSFSGHEWAIVRVRDSDELLQSEELPRAGFITAFHPLSGASYYDDTCHPDGQFYIFEQSEQLFRFTNPATGRRHVFCGASPFHWKKVVDNKFDILPSGSVVKFVNPGRSTKKRLMSITRLKDRDGMLAAHESTAGRPMLVHPTSKPASSELVAKRATAYARLVSNGPDMYKSRALPYPTMEEARHAFASWDEVDGHLDDLGA